MRIVVISGFSGSLPLFRGELLRLMVQRGHDVWACGPENDSNIVNQLQNMGVTFKSYPLERAGINIIKDLRTLYQLKKLIKTISPDLVLAYTAKPVIYGTIAASIARVPASYSMITGLGYGFTGTSMKRKCISFIMTKLYKFSLQKNSKVFFQNPDDLNLFVQSKMINKNKTVVINGSGVNLAHYRMQNGYHKKPVFLMIARLIWDKGIKEYFLASKLLKGKYPHAEFFLAGPLDPNPASLSKDEMEDWISSGVIEYLGSLEDVRDAISNCSVYVLPSYREGTPRTVLEAMAMGKAIVTTDTPGCRETVNNGKNGFLVPVKDHKKLADAMEKFIVNPEFIETMGQASYTLAKEKYDVHKVNESLRIQMNF